MLRPLFRRASNRATVKVLVDFRYDIDRGRYVWLGSPDKGLPGIEVKVCKSPGILKFRWDKTSECADLVDIETECKIWISSTESDIAFHIVDLIEKFIAEAIYDSDPHAERIEVTVSI